MSRLGEVAEVLLDLLLLTAPDPLPWEPKAWSPRRSSSAWSHALRRLERRGLVERLGPEGRPWRGRTAALRAKEGAQRCRC